MTTAHHTATTVTPRRFTGVTTKMRILAGLMLAGTIVTTSTDIAAAKSSSVHDDCRHSQHVVIYQPGNHDGVSRWMAIYNADRTQMLAHAVLAPNGTLPVPDGGEWIYYPTSSDDPWYRINGEKNCGGGDTTTSTTAAPATTSTSTSTTVAPTTTTSTAPTPTSTSIAPTTTSTSSTVAPTTSSTSSTVPVTSTSAKPAIVCPPGKLWRATTTAPAGDDGVYVIRVVVDGVEREARSSQPAWLSLPSSVPVQVEFSAPVNVECVDNPTTPTTTPVPPTVTTSDTTPLLPPATVNQPTTTTERTTTVTGELPRTGTTTAGLIGLGAALLAIGAAGATVEWRIRRDRDN